jgi:hypothetical protein
MCYASFCVFLLSRTHRRGCTVDRDEALVRGLLADLVLLGEILQVIATIAYGSL